MENVKRRLYSKLVEWKNESSRKPLILEGARQVGKTYLLRDFGQREYERLAYFNFEEDPKLASLFQGNLEPRHLIDQLSIYQSLKDDSKITPQSLIFFDEIQECPEALNSLKYFQESAPEYHVIAAGSLLGVKLKTLRSFPVGKVHFLQLHPLSFLEFLNAMDKTPLKDLLEAPLSLSPLPSIFHEELNQLLKTYLFVGGMPEAVQSYVHTREGSAVRKIQNDILRSFSLDFAKHAPPTDIMKISRIWSSIPSQLAREKKKFTLSLLHKNARGREYEGALQWLTDAGLIQKVYRISLPHLPLEGYREESVFKIYLLDTGLLGALCDLSYRTVVEGNEILTHFKGSLTENYVAQELKATHEKTLYYWESRGEAEVDFLLAWDEDVWPLEVKSGSSKKLRSLTEYSKKYHPPCLSLTSPDPFSKNNPLCHYPLYGISLFPGWARVGREKAST